MPRSAFDGSDVSGEASLGSTEPAFGSYQVIYSPRAARPVLAATRTGSDAAGRRIVPEGVLESVSNSKGVLKKPILESPRRLASVPQEIYSGAAGQLSPRLGSRDENLSKYGIDSMPSRLQQAILEGATDIRLVPILATTCFGRFGWEDAKGVAPASPGRTPRTSRCTCCGCSVLESSFSKHVAKCQLIAELECRRAESLRLEAEEKSAALQAENRGSWHELPRPRRSRSAEQCRDPRALSKPRRSHSQDQHRTQAVSLRSVEADDMPTQSDDKVWGRVRTESQGTAEQSGKEGSSPSISRTQFCTQCSRHVLASSFLEHQTRCRQIHSVERKEAEVAERKLQAELLKMEARSSWSGSPYACRSATRTKFCDSCNRWVLASSFAVHESKCQAVAELQSLQPTAASSTGLGPRTELCPCCQMYVLASSAAEHLRKCEQAINARYVRPPSPCAGPRTQQCPCCLSYVLSSSFEEHSSKCEEMTRQRSMPLANPRKQRQGAMQGSCSERSLPSEVQMTDFGRSDLSPVACQESPKHVCRRTSAKHILASTQAGQQAKCTQDAISKTAISLQSPSVSPMSETNEQRLDSLNTNTSSSGSLQSMSRLDSLKMCNASSSASLRSMSTVTPASGTLRKLSGMSDSRSTISMVVVTPRRNILSTQGPCTQPCSFCRKHVLKGSLEEHENKCKQLASEASDTKVDVFSGTGSTIPAGRHVVSIHRNTPSYGFGSSSRSSGRQLYMGQGRICPI
eukprot:TRINITY_DN4832_c0_g1_i2.p1 TRINITY_DN4832_c0_g1~~TRINITY_DN4832_c0_g1_i2.p1  ORF type:complete len:744 (-),score=95.02 TRINITY_DN4832_c0_g1_i2:40-2271(-)